MIQEVSLEINTNRLHPRDSAIPLKNNNKPEKILFVFQRFTTKKSFYFYISDYKFATQILFSLPRNATKSAVRNFLPAFGAPGELIISLLLPGGPN